jgi:uncharacterized protein
MKNIIKNFTESKKVAIIGVSEKAGNFGKGIYDELKKKNYELIPVNPNISTFDGKKCYGDVQEIPRDFENVIFAVSEGITNEILEKTTFQSVKNIWLCKGASSKRNIDKSREKNLGVVHTLCPLMFAYEKGFHRFHFNILKFFHILPEDYQKN